MNDDFRQFEQRKQDHIELALLPANQATEASVLDRIALWHEALPNLNFADIDCSSRRWNQHVPNPFMISSMTAGHQSAVAINTNLLAAASAQGWAMGVGSQRRELTDPNESAIWRNLRQTFPDVTLFSNLGIAQLITCSLSDLQRLTSAIQAQALIVHCNPLQEAIQPEGTPEFEGCWQALEQAVKTLELPIIVKETGCGFSPATLKKLNDIGVHAVDVSGLGGTHWGRIEGHRAPPTSNERRAAQIFSVWGMDTAQSIQFAKALQPSYEIWGSGGVRHGLDAAKLIALGATTIGFAKNMLAAALQSSDAVIAEMTAIEYELKLAMFCTGSRVLSELQGKLCPIPT
ncbi:MAG: type 2 isopentenyl-diphosphate Delta-isomerase [Gammaproteobacteria bacterium]|nr:type 2 isopentenyl-diphosphate Delta-isomerase [Gammaproteobacteria bacterium]